MIKPYRQRKEEEWKQDSKPADAFPIIDGILSANKAEAEKMRVEIEKGYEEAGRKFIMRALEEGVLTEQEWLEWKAKGAKEGDLCAPLNALFSRKDGHIKPDEEIKILRAEEDPFTDKFQAELEKKFGFKYVKASEIDKEFTPEQLKNLQMHTPQLNRE